MIARMSKSVSSFFILRGIISAEDRKVYEYSFEILISTVLSFLALAIVAIVSNTGLITLLYLLGFVPLRLIAGGYHAKTHFRCFIMLMITYSAFLLTNVFIPTGYVMITTILSTLTSITLVFLLAPSEDANKPVSNEECKKFRKKSRYAIIGYATLICMLAVLMADMNLALSIALGNLTVALSLLVNYIKIAKNNYNGRR